MREAHTFGQSASLRARHLQLIETLVDLILLRVVLLRPSVEARYDPEMVAEMRSTVQLGRVAVPIGRLIPTPALRQERSIVAVGHHVDPFTTLLVPTGNNGTKSDSKSGRDVKDR